MEKLTFKFIKRKQCVASGKSVDTLFIYISEYLLKKLNI